MYTRRGNLCIKRTRRSWLLNFETLSTYYPCAPPLLPTRINIPFNFGLPNDDGRFFNYFGVNFQNKCTPRPMYIYIYKHLRTYTPYIIRLYTKRNRRSSGGEIRLLYYARWGFVRVESKKIRFRKLYVFMYIYTESSGMFSVGAENGRVIYQDVRNLLGRVLALYTPTHVQRSKDTPTYLRVVQKRCTTAFCDATVRNTAVLKTSLIVSFKITTGFSKRQYGW